MIRNTAAEAMHSSQYSRQLMVVFDSDRANLRKTLLSMFFVLFICVIVVLAWLKLGPLTRASVDSDMHWKGVDEQLISERMVARNGKNWNASFTLSADDEKYWPHWILN